MAASILRRSPSLLIVIAVLTFALVAACGDGDDSSSAPQPSVSEQPAAEAAPQETVSTPEPPASEEEMPDAEEMAPEE